MNAFGTHLCKLLAFVWQCVHGSPYCADSEILYESTSLNEKCDFVFVVLRCLSPLFARAE